MGTRDEIRNEINEKKELIRKTEQEIADLCKEDALLIDDKQQFVEKIETRTTSFHRKKMVIEELIGRIHWKENFTDGDTGHVLTLDRSRVVKVNGEWLYFNNKLPLQ